MNGRKAKALRRSVYGDLSQREPHTLLRNSRTGVIINDPKSLRAHYKAVKREAKHGGHCG